MVQSEIIVRILIFGTLGMAILAGAVILFVINYQKKLLQQKNDLQELEIQFQKALFQSTLRSQESERQRIAQDLHDDLAGDLSALKLMLNRIPKYLKNEEMLGEITHSSKEMVIQAIDKVQHIARDLMPPMLEKLGLGVSLNELTQRLNHATETKIQFTEEEGPISLTHETQLNLYRISQELIQNALKYAEADQIDVMMSKQPFTLAIEDNGRGFDLEAEKRKPIQSGGIGLKSIETRLKMVGAQLEMHSKIGVGTHAKITLQPAHV